MEIKIGRTVLQITSEDRFMDNGSCIQLMTQFKSKGFNKTTYVIPKSLWKNIKNNMEETAGKPSAYAIKLTYYKIKEV